MAETLASVLKDTLSLDALRPLRHDEAAAQRCLERDPDSSTRLRDIGEAASDREDPRGLAGHNGGVGTGAKLPHHGLSSVACCRGSWQRHWAPPWSSRCRRHRPAISAAPTARHLLTNIGADALSARRTARALQPFCRLTNRRSRFVARQADRHGSSFGSSDQLQADSRTSRHRGRLEQPFFKPDGQ